MQNRKSRNQVGSILFISTNNSGGGARKSTPCAAKAAANKI
jgi:hypothetical protein